MAGVLTKAPGTGRSGVTGGNDMSGSGWDIVIVPWQKLLHLHLALDLDHSNAPVRPSRTSCTCRCERRNPKLRVQIRSSSPRSLIGWRREMREAKDGDGGQSKKIDQLL